MPANDSSTQVPRLADIAREAGLSKSLVSLALRGESGVSEKSRRRALEAARQLGHAPSAPALRKLEGPQVFGMLVTDLRNPFHTDILLGIERIAGDVSVILSNGGRDTERMRAHLRQFDALGVSGIMISSSWLDPADVAEAGKRRPVVVVGSSVTPVPGTDTVRGDLQLGIRLTVEHLIALGHRRIGFIAESKHSSSRRRHAAFLEQTMRFLQRDSTVSAHIDDLVADPESVVDLVRRRGITAFVAANDVTAIEFMRVARDVGLRIPEEVAIAGYDNISNSRVTTPELTTVDQPWESMGAKALTFLRERALGRTADRDEVMTPRLVVRGSTSAA